MVVNINDTITNLPGRIQHNGPSSSCNLICRTTLSPESSLSAPFSQTSSSSPNTSKLSLSDEYIDVGDAGRSALEFATAFLRGIGFLVFCVAFGGGVLSNTMNLFLKWHFHPSLPVMAPSFGTTTHLDGAPSVRRPNSANQSRKQKLLPPWRIRENKDR